MTSATPEPAPAPDGETSAPAPVVSTPVPSALHIPLMAIGTVCAVAVVWAHRDNWFWAVLFGALVLVAAHLSAIDFHEQRLPNRIVVPLAGAATVAVLLFGVIESDLGRSFRALGLGVLTFFVLLLLNLAGGMGMGDVKFGFPLGATLGWFGADTLIVGAMAMVLAGGVFAVGVLIRTRSKNAFFAFGPFMAIGLVVGLLTAGSF